MPPEDLGAEAREEWDRLVPILLEMSVLTRADYMALGALCQAYATWRGAVRQLNGQELTYETKNGYHQPNPVLGVINRSADQIRKFSEQFGLTPSARTRVEAINPAGASADPWAKFAEGGKAERTQ